MYICFNPETFLSLSPPNLRSFSFSITAGTGRNYREKEKERERERGPKLTRKCCCRETGPESTGNGEKRAESGGEKEVANLPGAGKGRSGCGAGRLCRPRPAVDRAPARAHARLLPGAERQRFRCNVLDAVRRWRGGSPGARWCACPRARALACPRGWCLKKKERFQKHKRKQKVCTRADQRKEK